MQTILITGGHKGIGLEAARTIVGHSDSVVILAGRDPHAMSDAVRELSSSGRKVIPLEMDVSSLESVRAASRTLLQYIDEGKIPPLGALVLNAGAQFLGAPRYSADGIEQTFATNCAGHYLLVHLLVDAMADGGRVVFTASGTHDPDSMDGKMVGKAVDADAFMLANLDRAPQRISGGQRYTTSKLCTMLYAYELHRLLSASGRNIEAIAFDPGLVPETGLARSAPAIVQRLLRSAFAKWLFSALGVTMGSLKFSGESLGRIAVDDDFRAVSGRYLQSNAGRLIEARSSQASYNEQLAHKVWEDTGRLVKLGAQERPRALYGNA